MKNLLIALLALVALSMVGCSPTETSQDKVDQDAKDITLDKNAAPDPTATEDIGIPPGGPKKGGG